MIFLFAGEDEGRTVVAQPGPAVLLLRVAISISFLAFLV
jgi:hypothetical protein